MTINKTRFKSRQVNTDPEPWESINHGKRGATALVYDDMYYRPRPEFEPTRDPEPWVNVFGNRVRSPGRTDDGEFRWAPRREEFDTPVNRVLEQVRLQTTRTGDFLTVAKNILVALERGEQSLQVRLLDWNLEEIEHARKVLTRLVEWKAHE